MEMQKGKVGELVERIMFQWLENCRLKSAPEPTTPQYNAAYEAVIAVLSNSAREEAGT